MSVLPDCQLMENLQGVNTHLAKAQRAWYVFQIAISAALWELGSSHLASPLDLELVD